MVLVLMMLGEHMVVEEDFDKGKGMEIYKYLNDVNNFVEEALEVVFGEMVLEVEVYMHYLLGPVDKVEGCKN
jgi:hypothetical protein